jgi:hypothetical protein
MQQRGTDAQAEFRGALGRLPFPLKSAAHQVTTATLPGRRDIIA